MKAVWLRVGGRYAITLRAWLLLAPVAILGTPGFVPEGIRPDSPLWAGYLVGLIAHLVTGLVLILAYLTYLSPKKVRKSRPLAAVATLAVAGLARGFSVAFFFEFFGVVLEADYFPRMIAGAIIVTIWFGVTAVLVGARQQYVLVYKELTESLERAKALASQGAEQVANTRAALVNEVKATLSEAFSSRQSTTELHNLADSVIRPLSHSLASHQPVVVDAKTPKRRIKLGPVVRTALHEYPFIPIPVAAIGLLSTLYSKVWGIGLAGFLETLIQAVIIVVLFTLFQALRVRGWLVPIAWLVASLSATLVSWLALQYDLATNLGPAIQLSVSIFLPAGFVSMLLAYDKEAERKLALLQQALEQVEWQERKLNQQLWIEKKRLARYVHSDIQGRVRAAALSNTVGTMADVQKLQEECVAALDLSRELPSFDRFYADTVELWGGVTNISLDADPLAMQAISNDSFGLASVVEIVREGIGNAVKHGKAKNIEVGLRVLTQNNPCLEVFVLNDGLPTTSGPQSGFGVQTVAEVSSSWGLEEDNGRTRLWAKVPVSSVQ
ncbi:MAG TPA: hypothetical protein VIB80_03985 [Aquiluna sp.]